MGRLKTTGMREGNLIAGMTENHWKKHLRSEYFIKCTIFVLYDCSDEYLTDVSYMITPNFIRV